MLQEHPELLLPYLIYLLAHHPDFPEPPPGAQDELQEVLDLDLGGEGHPEAAAFCEALAPFQAMLQFALEPLLAPCRGLAAGATLPAILKVLKYIKMTEDAQVRRLGLGLGLNQG